MHLLAAHGWWEAQEANLLHKKDLRKGLEREQEWFIGEQAVPY
jgi:glutaredoxin-related protein